MLCYAKTTGLSEFFVILRKTDKVTLGELLEFLVQLCFLPVNYETGWSSDSFSSRQRPQLATIRVRVFCFL